jgi:5-methylcytosine-specific restriction endonuclease McrA
MPMEQLRPRKKSGRASVEREIPRAPVDRMIQRPPRSRAVRMSRPYREECWPAASYVHD